MSGASATLRIRELIAACNNAKTDHEHVRAMGKLEGYKEACFTLDVGYDWTDADLHHQGTDAERPMCLGVFLDWKPESKGES